MKKFAPFLVFFLFLLVAWEATIGQDGLSFVLDDDELGGPIGALVGLVLLAVGIVVGVIAAVIGAVVVTVACAGLGVLAVIGVAVAVIAVLAAISPVLLLLLIPVGLVWLVTRKSKTVAKV